jgi:hypothetical protein
MNGFRLLVSGFRLDARARWCGHVLCGLLPSAVCLLLSGCTSRGLTITSEPPGAEVSINHEVVGTTPVHVGFTHYGTFRFELRKGTYETLVKEETINPRVWGYDPFAFAADNAIPARLNDEVYLHYVLQPEKPAGDRAELLQRAEVARDGTATNPKTGEQAQVAYTSPSKDKPYTVQPAPGTAAAGEGGAAPAEAPAEVVKPISAEQPEGLRLAKELGLETPEKKLDQAQAAEKKEAAPPTPARAPKTEELIYETPGKK